MTTFEDAEVTLQDVNTGVDYKVDMKFVDKVLDFKRKLRGRRPTRYELQGLLKAAPKDIFEEIQQMFKEYAKNDC